MNGEALVLEGFARNEFLMQGRNTREFGPKKMEGTEHDLDFIFFKGQRGLWSQSEE